VTQQKRHGISDSDWERIKKYFPEITGHTMGRPGKDSRTVLNGILWIPGTGAAWRDMPERCEAWQTVYKRFSQWSREGLFERIFSDMTVDADMENIASRASD